MIIDQISVFAENKPGSLSGITKLLADAVIDIKALTIADTEKYGILRLIVDKPDKALEVLKGGGFIAKKAPVIAIEMDNKPGSLASIIGLLAEKDVSIEYLYAFVAQTIEQAYVVIRVEDEESAAKILAEAGYTNGSKISFDK